MSSLRDNEYHVFLSHSRDSRDFAVRLTAHLRAARFRVFLDDRELEPAAPFDETLRQAVENSVSLLFVVSAGSVEASSYALSELGWAVDSGRALLCVHAPGHEQVTPPPELDAVTYVKIRGDRIAETVAAASKLLRARRGRRLWLAASAVLGAGVLAAATAAVVRTLPTVPPYIGTVYDYNERPLAKVLVALKGAGPAKDCPSVETDERGGFSFEGCRTAHRLQNPEAVLTLPGREPCTKAFKLEKPPHVTAVTIDPKDPTCLPDTELAAKKLSPPELGKRLFQGLGCNTCHPLQETERPSIGGSLAGLFGKEVQLADGTTIVADRYYIRESIRYPAAKQVAGRAPVMPLVRLSDDRLEALVEYISELR